MLVNNTRHAVAQAILMDVAGRETLVLAVKASFAWRPDGTLVAVDPAPVVTVDRFGDPIDASGLRAASELTLAKPRVDVILTGEIVLPSAVGQVDCTLAVGDEVRKTLRLFGDRHWRPSAISSVVPSSPRPFTRMPIAWERSFGGRDPDEPGWVERRNPVGRGMRRRTAALEGHPAPNFEDPRHPVRDPLQRPAPVGFGPVAPHWQPRCDFAGTYDEAWQRDRFPLLPADFDPRFLNAAAADQQMARYEPGTPVFLQNLTAAGRDRFALPVFAPAVTVVDDRALITVPAVVDTVVLEPAAARLSLVARATHVSAAVENLKAVYVGPLTPGQRRALATGKPYVRLSA